MILGLSQKRIQTEKKEIFCGLKHMLIKDDATLISTFSPSLFYIYSLTSPDITATTAPPLFIPFVLFAFNFCYIIWIANAGNKVRKLYF